MWEISTNLGFRHLCCAGVIRHSRGKAIFQDKMCKFLTILRQHTGLLQMLFKMKLIFKFGVHYLMAILQTI